MILAISSRALPPSWPYRSISTKPSTASSQSTQARIWIWVLSSEPGSVWVRPRNVILARSPASRRSMVAGDVATGAAVVCSQMSSSPKWRSVGPARP